MVMVNKYLLKKFIVKINLCALDVKQFSTFGVCCGFVVVLIVVVDMFTALYKMPPVAVE